MSRERTARILTLAVLVLAVGVVAVRQTSWLRPAPKVQTAQDAIYRMLDAAKAGDASGYLECYTGQMQAALRQSLVEMTGPGLAEYLRKSNAAIKGVAIQEPRMLTDREVKVRVEYIYQDRNEIQWMYLEKAGGTWKIARIDTAERIKTLVPYGTPVQ